MRSYLAVTGTIFGLMAALHLWRLVAEWAQLARHPVDLMSIVVFGVVAAGLSLWGWRLFARAA